SKRSRRPSPASPSGLARISLSTCRSASTCRRSPRPSPVWGSSRARRMPSTGSRMPPSWSGSRILSPTRGSGMWWRTSDPAPEAAPDAASGGVSSPRRRSLEVGALAVAVVYAAGTLASLAGPPPGAVAIACAVLAGVLVLIAVLRARAGITAAYAAACAVVGAAWLGFAAVTTAWAPLDIAALVLPAAILIWLYPVIRAQQDRLAAEAREAQEAAAAAKAQRRWPDLIGRIGYAGVRFAGQ